MGSGTRHKNSLFNSFLKALPRFYTPYVDILVSTPPKCHTPLQKHEPAYVDNLVPSCTPLQIVKIIADLRYGNHWVRAYLIATKTF